MSERSPLQDSKRESSLVATLKGWQELYDSGAWDGGMLAAAVMHLDIDAEGESGEIQELRAWQLQATVELKQARSEAEALAEALEVLMDALGDPPRDPFPDGIRPWNDAGAAVGAYRARHPKETP